MRITLVKSRMFNGYAKGLPNKIGRPFFFLKIYTALILGIVFSQGMSSQVMASSDDVDVRARQQYNQAIERIYNKIVLLKSQYPELQDFSKNAMRQDENGFYSLSYEYDLQGQYGYRLLVRADHRIQEDVFDDEDSWSLKFPLLKFNVLVVSKLLGNRTAIKLNKLIHEDMQELKTLEQSYLPFHLELSTDKKVYNVQELITLTVLLKNAGSGAFKVADLNEKSLYCTIDNTVWGEKSAALKLNRILAPYGSLTKTLKVRGMSSSKNVWLACTYGLGFKGVQPYSRIKVSIKSAP